MAWWPIEATFLLLVTTTSLGVILMLVIDWLWISQRFWRSHWYTRHNRYVHVSYVVEDGNCSVCCSSVCFASIWIINRTNTLLKKLIQFVVHRGAFVTLIQTLLLITFYAAPNHVYWYCLCTSLDIPIKYLLLGWLFTLTSQNCMQTRSVRISSRLWTFQSNFTNIYTLVAMWVLLFINKYFWCLKCRGRLNGRQHLKETLAHSKLFTSVNSQSTRDTHKLRNESYDFLHIEAQVWQK